MDFWVRKPSLSSTQSVSEPHFYSWSLTNNHALIVTLIHSLQTFINTHLPWAVCLEEHVNIYFLTVSCLYLCSDRLHNLFVAFYFENNLSLITWISSMLCLFYYFLITNTLTLYQLSLHFNSQFKWLFIHFCKYCQSVIISSHCSLTVVSVFTIVHIPHKRKSELELQNEVFESIWK